MSIKQPKDPGESVVVEFDFSSELAAVDSATLEVSVTGTKPDPAAAAILDGPFQIASNIVYQRISGGVDGVDYKLRCLGSNASGDIILRTDVVKVRKG